MSFCLLFILFQVVSCAEYLLQPQNTYFEKGHRSVTLKCSAQGILYIKWKCNGNWILADHPDKFNTIPLTLKKTYIIHLAQLKENEEFWCQCFAYTSKTEYIKSNKAYVAKPKLEEQFVRHPMSRNVMLGGQLKLTCVPPKGTPIPTLTWLKDGKPLKSKLNFRLTTDQSLIVNVVTLKHRGNYSCLAENPAGTRKSVPAEVTVYVNGEWSPWSTWSACDVKCGRGHTHRQRNCDNPAPMYGGLDCIGYEIERDDCQRVCSVDGGWSAWQPWGACSTECLQHRRRDCNSPKPQNSGRPCVGSPLESANCTGHFCNSAYHGEMTDTNFKGVGRHPLMLVLLIIVCICFIIVSVTFISMMFCRRRYVSRFGCIYNSSIESKRQGEIMPQLSTNKELTSQMLSDGTFYKPLYMNQNKSSLSAATGKKQIPSISTVSFKEQSDPEVVYAPGNVYERIDTVTPELPRVLPSTGSEYSHFSQASSSGVFSMEDSNSEDINFPNLPVDCFASGKVESIGGRLSLPKSGIDLLIPEGAIPNGQAYNLWIGVWRETTGQPVLRHGESILSPVILCGSKPDGFLKPLVLSFYHCAHEIESDWSVSLRSCSQLPNSSSHHWKVEPISSEMLLSENRCSVFLSSLSSSYCLVGRSNMSQHASKRLALTCFTSIQQYTHEINFRIYCVDDNRDAVESVISSESKLNGQLIAPVNSMLFSDSGHNLCLTLDHLNTGWNVKLSANYQEIPFAHVWQNSQCILHTSFGLERNNSYMHELHFNVNIFQASLPAEFQTISVNIDTNKPLVAAPFPRDFVDPYELVFRLTTSTKQTLQRLLDISHPSGNDWRMLVRKLRFDGLQPYFSQQPSPSESVLTLWEARFRNSSAVRDLVKIFRNMGRTDCSTLVQQESSYYS